MNKQKKLKQIHQKRLKAAHAKVDSKKKAPYISKAERAKLEEIQETSQDTETKEFWHQGLKPGLDAPNQS